MGKTDARLELAKVLLYPGSRGCLKYLKVLRAECWPTVIPRCLLAKSEDQLKNRSV
jgi:hypothetical protein